MTRKDYIIIANAIKDSGPLKYATPMLVVVNVANALQRDNPQFDHERFYKACGID